MKTIIRLASSNPHKLTEIAAAVTPLGLQLEQVSDFIDVDETGESFEENAILKACAYLQSHLSSHGRNKKIDVAMLADDSGLCVDALGGLPGVYSARFAQRYAPESFVRSFGDNFHAANNDYLLERLVTAAKQGNENRGAYFHTTMCLATYSGELYEVLQSALHLSDRHGRSSQSSDVQRRIKVTSDVVIRRESDGVILLLASGVAKGRITQSAHGRNGFGYDPIFFSDELGKTFGDATREEKLRVSHRSRALQALQGALTILQSGRIVGE